MEQVVKTAEHGHYLRPFAKIILALAARREKQVPLAEKLLRELCEQTLTLYCMLRSMPRYRALRFGRPRFADLCLVCGLAFDYQNP